LCSKYHGRCFHRLDKIGFVALAVAVVVVVVAAAAAVAAVAAAVAAVAAVVDVAVVVSAANDVEDVFVPAVPVVAVFVPVASGDEVVLALGVTVVAVNEEEFAVNHLVATAPVAAGVVLRPDFAVAFDRSFALYYLLAPGHDCNLVLRPSSYLNERDYFGFVRAVVELSASAVVRKLVMVREDLHRSRGDSVYRCCCL